MSDASPSRHPRGDSTSMFKGLKGWLRALRRGRNGEPSLRETIEEIIEESETEVDEPITEDESTLLRNILQLRNLTAYDVIERLAERPGQGDGDQRPFAPAGLSRDAR